MELSSLSILCGLPLLAWFFLWRAQDQEKEPFKAMIICLFFGLIAAGCTLFLGSFIEGFSGVWELWIYAFLEEFIKAFLLVAAIECTRHWFTQIVDGLIYGAAIGLGFSLAENMVYLTELPQTDALFWTVYLVRSLNTMVAHSLFTGLFGFFYASAYLRKEIFPESKKEKPWHHFLKNIGEAMPLHVTIFHLLPHRPSNHGHYPGSLILEGMIVVTLLHGFLNTFLTQQLNGYSLSFLTYPLLFFLAWMVWRIFLAKIYTKIVYRMKR